MDDASRPSDAPTDPVGTLAFVVTAVEVPGGLLLRPPLWTRAIALGLGAVGAGGVLWGLGLVPPAPEEGSAGWAVAVGALLALTTVGFSLWRKKTLLDTTAGRLRLHHGLVGTAPREVPFANVEAVQLLDYETGSSSTGGQTHYQVNLVLAGGERLTVSNYAGEARHEGLARRLSEVLEAPLVDGRGA